MAKRRKIEKPLEQDIRYRVFDRTDKLCGIWYASSETEAISLAISEGYDAWSARATPSG